MILHAVTIFLSAFLLFLVQPIIAKQILPWFGGSAAVWSTCLVFFQLTLLAGYLYTDWSTRKLSVKRQAILHASLIAIALLLLPIIPDAGWKPHANGWGDAQPSLRILMLLTATIGLPYFLLSTTSPLVQTWFARAHPGASPYRLFALSNLASMLALMGYPFLVEPAVVTRYQAIFWSAAFGVFAVLIVIAILRVLRVEKGSGTAPLVASIGSISQPAPTAADKTIWIALAGLGSTLLLGVSNHLTQNIASVPLLWVVPLAIYLLTFILSFSGNAGTASWYPRGISLSQTALAIFSMAWLLAEKRLDFMLFLHIVVFTGGLFITCMFCHGELAERKPAPQHLTTFYLMVAVGGALGALLIGILAPLVLPGYYELGFTLIALALLGTWLQWRRVHWVWMAAGTAVCVFTVWASIHSVSAYREDVVVMSRNFYGSLRVKESKPSDSDRKRSLVHGAILHGDQYLDTRRRHIATTYFRTTSGVGIALLEKHRALTRPLRVGIIGLGAGTLAAYGSKGDVIRFYEIDPAVVQIAQRDFTYLQDSNAAIEIVLGDARLTLESEAAQHFDVLIIDAFSSDSIPVHLITQEALAVYEKHVQPDGIIAFHVSNRFLDLTPVVGRLAVARGLSFAWINETHDDGRTASDWVLLCKEQGMLRNPAIAAATKPIVIKPGVRVWTDDFNNLVQALK